MSALDAHRLRRTALDIVGEPAPSGVAEGVSIRGGCEGDGGGGFVRDELPRRRSCEDAAGGDGEPDTEMRRRA